MTFGGREPLNSSTCSGERVLLFGDKPVGLQDLGLNDIEDDNLSIVSIDDHNHDGTRKTHRTQLEY